MGMSEREYHIKVLENLLSHYKAREQCEGYYDSTLKDNVEALEYAISSIKTDEAYQIMYEGGEIFTKADMVAMLTEIQLEIADNVESIIGHYDASTPERKRPLCKSARNEGRTECIDVIQEKINALKGDSND